MTERDAGQGEMTTGTELDPVGKKIEQWLSDVALEHDDHAMSTEKREPITRDTDEQVIVMRKKYQN